MVELSETIKFRLRNPFVVAAVVFGVLVYSGILAPSERNPFQSGIPVENVTALSGKISSNPSRTSSGKFYSCRIAPNWAEGYVGACSAQSSAAGTVNLLIPSAIVESLYPGRLFSVSQGKILVESGENVCVRGKFASSGIFVVKSSEYLGYDASAFGIISHFRALCRLKFKRLMFSWGDCGGLILSLLSGSREYMEFSTAESFKRAGLSHILALSGMHLSFFSSLAGTCGSTFLGKRFSFWARLAGILFFAWFAGLSPSLFRALVCSLIMLVCGAVFCSGIDMLPVLCASFLIHASVFPGDLYSAAFLLSYGALGGILLAGDALSFLLTSIFPAKISSSLGASIGAQAATCPISLSLFGCFMPFGVFASVVVSPLISLFLTCAVSSIILCLILPFLSPIFSCIMNGFYSVLVAIVKFFALFPAVEV